MANYRLNDDGTIYKVPVYSTKKKKKTETSATSSPTVSEQFRKAGASAYHVNLDGTVEDLVGDAVHTKTLTEDFKNTVSRYKNGQWNTKDAVASTFYNDYLTNLENTGKTSTKKKTSGTADATTALTTGKTGLNTDSTDYSAILGGSKKKADTTSDFSALMGTTAKKTTSGSSVADIVAKASEKSTKTTEGTSDQEKWVKKQKANIEKISSLSIEDVDLLTKAVYGVSQTGRTTGATRLTLSQSGVVSGHHDADTEKKLKVQEKALAELKDKGYSADEISSLTDTIERAGFVKSSV